MSSRKWNSHSSKQQSGSSEEVVPVFFFASFWGLQPSNVLDYDHLQHSLAESTESLSGDSASFMRRKV